MDKVNFKYKSFFSHLITEGEQCAMVEVPPFQSLIEFVKAIPDEIVYQPGSADYGKEKNPHVTILYGIEASDETKAKGLLNRMNKKINVQLGKVTLFTNNPQFDVLKIDVHSQDLTQLNALLSKSVKFKNDYPGYHPHLTLAYLKKGQGKQYNGDNRFEGMNLSLDTIIYSDGNTTEKLTPSDLNEYGYGSGGGYGGAYGGPAAPSGWAGTSSCPQSMNRLDKHPLGRRSYYMQGNTIINSEPYSSVTDDDLKDPNFPATEIWAGLRYEMKKTEFPNKDEAKAIVLQNLRKNPKYYSDLDMYPNK